MKRAALLSLAALPLVAAPAFRPPAVPLVTHDPYFSVWSAFDHLHAGHTRHWTGAPHRLHSMVRVDGTSFRLMGLGPGSRPSPADPPALEQRSLEVWPARTIYRFAGAGVEVTLTFLTPALPQDLDLLSRPATYLVWDVRSADGSPHEVAIYFDAAADLAVNEASQPVVWGRFRTGELRVLRMGSAAQPVLGRTGDNLRIDWGYLYVAVPASGGAQLAACDRRQAFNAFRESGRAPESDDLEPQSMQRDRLPVLAAVFDLGRVAAEPVSRHLILAYDDLFSIEYFHRRLRPYWRRNGMTAAAMLDAAAREYVSLAGRCRRYDEELVADLRRAGGEEYAHIATLAYRQTLAAHKLAADADGTPLYFSKENFSNGCIATVDVTYPSAPFFLVFNPRLLEAMLEPVLYYASLERWKFPFAPHDLGTYPLANGQVYGGGEENEERQMPVEESGNMLVLAAAHARAVGGAAFAGRHWPRLERWARYLEEKGLDPENQLCTDDFAGHLARNANLSVKAIMGLASYAALCRERGLAPEAEKYSAAARRFAGEWMRLADGGGRTLLAFGQSGTWSQKYNLVWDRLLGFGLFPPEVARREIAWYKRAQGAYGLPLDSRERYTKLDWILWSATLAENAEDFRALVAPVYRFLNETPDRVPMPDWYWTHDARQRGFQARSVVGGVYIKLLADEALAKKWRDRAR